MNEVKVGSKIKVFNVNDDFIGSDKYKGKIGKVTSIEKDGSILGTWGDIPLLPQDDFIVLEDDPIKSVKLDNEIYTEIDVKSMSVSEIKNLLAKCNASIQSIGVRKNMYITEFMDAPHDKRYWSKVNGFKYAISKIQEGISWITEIKREKQKKEVEDKEHYLYMFYKECKETISEETMNNILDSLKDKGYDLRKVL